MNGVGGWGVCLPISGMGQNNTRSRKHVSPKIQHVRQLKAVFHEISFFDQFGLSGVFPGMGVERTNDYSFARAPPPPRKRITHMPSLYADQQITLFPQTQRTRPAQSSSLHATAVDVAKTVGHSPQHLLHSSHQTKEMLSDVAVRQKLPMRTYVHKWDTINHRKPRAATRE